MASVTPELKSFKRIVVKVGSSLLVNAERGELYSDWLNALAEDLAERAKAGAQIVVVSSGAIALGRTVLKFAKGALKLEESQAAAAVGQIALARAWSEALGKVGLVAGQVLLTLKDTEERRNYLNARATIGKLLDINAVPVINENDTVATSEIRYGDNDRLAARVASMIGADLLILFSDIDGFYDAPPHLKKDAKLIPVISRITAEIEGMAGAAGSELSRGGMVTKVEAAKIATLAGAHMIIASGRKMHPVRADREWRGLHLVSDAREPGNCAQEMDRRKPRAARHYPYRCRCGSGAAQRQELAPRRRGKGCRRICARRCRIGARSGRRRDRTRTCGLRFGRRGQDREEIDKRDCAHSGL
jgi:glutamate 5-kinase